MSTAEWPSKWGKEHEVLCALSSIFARKRKHGEVELWRSDRATKYCIGVVPEDISHQTLQVVIAAVIGSYERGVADGRAALAASILAPISAALRSAE